MHHMFDSARNLLPTAIAMALAGANGALAVDADDVTFDDSATITIQGADVQAALESADVEITDLVDHHAGVDPNADVVYVRQDCTGIKNCFTSMSVLAGVESANFPTHPSTKTNSSWLWALRQPTPASPLLIDVGPGTWEPFICPDHTTGAKFGGVTLRGAGRETTVLVADEAGYDAQNCFDMQTMDLTLRGGFYGVRWANGGAGNWHDVDMIGENESVSPSAGWFDGCTTQTPTPSLHYLFNVRAIGRGGSAHRFAYVASCSETWFFGGEIRLEADGFDAAEIASLFVSSGSDFRAFGTAIRALARDLPDSEDVVGVKVVGDPSQQTQFHLHGGIVSLHGSAAGGATVDATGLDASGNAFAHTPGSAWVIRAPDGTATRVTTSGGAVAQVPFHWQSGTSEPEAGLVSQTGSDVFVETDCNNATGVCDGSGTTRPHLMIYDATCTPTPWFDVVTGACRLP